MATTNTTTILNPTSSLSLTIPSITATVPFPTTTLRPALNVLESNYYKLNISYVYSKFASNISTCTSNSVSACFIQDDSVNLPLDLCSKANLCNGLVCGDSIGNPVSSYKKGCYLSINMTFDASTTGKTTYAMYIRNGRSAIVNSKTISVSSSGAVTTIAPSPKPSPSPRFLPGRTPASAPSINYGLIIGLVIGGMLLATAAVYGSRNTSLEERKRKRAEAQARLDALNQSAPGGVAIQYELPSYSNQPAFQQEHYVAQLASSPQQQYAPQSPYSQQQQITSQPAYSQPYVVPGAAFQPSPGVASQNSSVQYSAYEVPSPQSASKPKGATTYV
ncbi:hypothetical protein BC829DRAFT_439853 [Chytridium lagenaria]|nr:hypothetical protein BC829DRAFT_439853 [Chytridium lagenaria]